MLIGAVRVVRFRLVRTTVRERPVEACAFGLCPERLRAFGLNRDPVRAPTGVVLDGFVRRRSAERFAELFARVLGAVVVAFLSCDPWGAAMAAVGTANAATNPTAISFSLM
jgi:hypothetical protein